MNSNKYYSHIQESSIASNLGWSVVAGSGARSTYPGDIESDIWLGECKTHASPNHTIVFNYNVWKKISKEAISKFKYPVLFVDDGSQSLNKTWCMIPNSIRGITMDIYPYPYTIRRNVSFNCDDLTTYSKSLGCSDNFGFMLKFHDECVYVVPFYCFISMFGS